MSVEKLSDCSKTILQENPFTQICNQVILNIKDNDAFRAYCYLQSKSKEWKVIREDLRKMCGIGLRKLDQVFSYLKRCNLITYVKILNNKGQFVRTDIKVLNGLNFDENVNFLSEKVTENQTLRHIASTPAETAAAETATAEKAILLKERRTKERLTKKRKAKSFGASLPKKQKIPIDYCPTETHKAMASDFKLDLDIERANFVDWFTDTGVKRENWHLSFNRWLRKSYLDKKPQKEHPVTSVIREIKEKTQSVKCSDDFNSFLN